MNIDLKTIERETQRIKTLFAEDVREHLFDPYLLDDWRVVYGQSTSHTKSWVRNMNKSGRRWKNLGNDSHFENLCKEAGFKVERGRGRRIYKGGVYAWGVPCDVITELRPYTEPLEIDREKHG